MTWDGIVTTYHRRHSRELEVDDHIQAYIQSRVLKMTLESMTFDRRRELPQDGIEADLLQTLEGKAQVQTA